MVDDDGTWEVVGGTRFLVSPSQAWLDAQAAIVDEPSPFAVAQAAWVGLVSDLGANAVGVAARLAQPIADSATELATAAAEIADPATQTFAQIVADAADAAAS